MSAETVSAMAILIPPLAGALVVISRELRRWVAMYRGSVKRGKPASIAASA